MAGVGSGPAAGPGSGPALRFTPAGFGRTNLNLSSWRADGRWSAGSSGGRSDGDFGADLAAASAVRSETGRIRVRESTGSAASDRGAAGVESELVREEVRVELALATRAFSPANRLLRLALESVMFDKPAAAEAAVLSSPLRTPWSVEPGGDTPSEHPVSKTSVRSSLKLGSSLAGRRDSGRSVGGRSELRGGWVDWAGRSAFPAGVSAGGPPPLTVSAGSSSAAGSSHRRRSSSASSAASRSSRPSRPRISSPAGDTVSQTHPTRQVITRETATSYTHWQLLTTHIFLAIYSVVLTLN